MDIESASSRQGDLSAGVLIPVALPHGDGGNEALHQAQPAMGQHESPSTEQIETYGALMSTALAEGEITVRRRSSSAGDAGIGERSGAREMNLVRTIAKDIRQENSSGLNKAHRNLLNQGYDRILVDTLIDHHDRYRWITRALAGASGRASDAQLANAFALCIFDVNREIFMRHVLESAHADGPSPSDAQKTRDEQMKKLVQGAKLLSGFAELQLILKLFIQMRVDTGVADRAAMMPLLVSDAGLFETNARRFLNAFDEAASGNHDDGDLRQRLPTCLKRQWMTGISEQEREALRDVSAEESAEFHRKLKQQYALLCRSFGLSLPPMSELIMVDDDD